MYRLMAVGLVILVASGPAAAMGGEAGDVENAHMNALAGGPTNEFDAWLLERYGCYSGTRSAFCEQLNHQSPAPVGARYPQRRDSDLTSERNYPRSFVRDAR